MGTSGHNEARDQSLSGRAMSAAPVRPLCSSDRGVSQAAAPQQRQQWLIRELTELILNGSNLFHQCSLRSHSASALHSRSSHPTRSESNRIGSDRPDLLAPSPRLAMRTAASKLVLLALASFLALVQLALEPCTAAASQSQPVNPANPLRVSFPLVGSSFDLRRLRDPAMNLAPGERRGFYNILDTSFVTGVASANYSYIFNVSVRAGKIATASEPQREWPAGLRNIASTTDLLAICCNCA
jgi:hypothetical protein